MSSADCATCDCPDKTNCPKKQGFQSQDAVVNRAYDMSFFIYQTAGVENDCKCGPNCLCTNSTCH